DRLHHARIGSATAEVAVHVRANLCFGGAWILRQQLGALDQHSVVAIAALRRLLVDERLLQRMEHWRLREPLLLCVERREALERGQRFVGDRRNRRHAGADLDAVGEHRARAALRQPAAEAVRSILPLKPFARACGMPAGWRSWFAPAGRAD